MNTSRFVEGLELRTLFSAVPADAQLVFATQPRNATTDGRPRQGIVVALVNSDGKLIPQSPRGKVALSVASGSNAGDVVASARLMGGNAIFRELGLHTVDTYTVRASLGSVISGPSAPFMILPGVGAEMSVVGYAEAAWSGTANFVATIYDRFGNIATDDISYISLWRNHDRLLGINAMGMNVVYSKRGTFLGIRFSNGVADFSCQANAGPRTVSVIFADSDRRVNHVHSLKWLAHL
ncbi:MAG TPA: hypothetical protein VIM11_20890 [Tepidisphaeraceae bacterium]|jgi:hypothetical protein